MSEVNAGYDTGRYRSTREQLRRSLSQDVTDDSPIARRERAGRARLAIARREAERAAAPSGWTTDPNRNAEPPSSRSAMPPSDEVSGLVAKHEGDMRAVVRDTAFIASVRHMLGTDSDVTQRDVPATDRDVELESWVADALGSDTAAYAAERDPMLRQREREDTLAVINELREEVGEPALSEEGLLTLAGLGPRPEAFTQLHEENVAAVRAAGLTTDELVDSPSPWQSLPSDWVGLRDAERAEPPARVMLDGDEPVFRAFPNDLAVDDVEVSLAQVAAHLGTSEQNVEELARRLRDNYVRALDAIDRSVTIDAPERIDEPAPAMAVDVDSPRVARDLEVTVSGPDDASPRFAGIDEYGSRAELASDPDTLGFWLEIDPRSAEALAQEITSRATQEAVWAPPGDRTTARLSDLEPDERSEVISLGPNPPPEVLPDAQRDADSPLVRRGTSGQMVDLSQSQARLQAKSVGHAANSLDSLGVGHPSYGMNRRPDHPQPGTDPTQQRI